VIIRLLTLVEIVGSQRLQGRYGLLFVIAISEQLQALADQGQSLSLYIQRVPAPDQIRGRIFRRNGG